MEINRNLATKAKVNKDLVTKAKERQIANSKTRLENRDLDRKEKVNISEQIERIQIDTSIRTSGAVRKGLDKLSDIMTTASDGLNTIRNNLSSIRSIVDASLKGTLTDNNLGQSQINDLVAGIKSVVDNTKFGDKKVFGGSFSYDVFKNANLEKTSGNFANTQTGIVNPPTGSSSTTTTTGGLVWQNTSIDTSTFSSTNPVNQTRIASNDQYLVKLTGYSSGNNKDYQQAVINKTTGAVVSNSTGVSDTNYGKLIALNNNNQLVAASDTSLKLSNILAPKDAQGNSVGTIELLDSSGNSISGIEALDISNKYVVASKSKANGGTAYVFNATTGALLHEIKEGSSTAATNTAASTLLANLTGPSVQSINSQTLNGTTGADVLKIQGSSNTINAGTGDDTVYIKGNTNIIDAGAGDNTVYAEGNSNAVYTTASAGNNTINIMGGNSNNVNAGVGNDTINVIGGISNTVFAGSGNDIIDVTDNSSASIYAGSGDDTIKIRGNTINSLVSGGSGFDTVRFEGKASDYTTSSDASNNLIYSKGGQVVATLRDDIDMVEFFNPLDNTVESNLTGPSRDGLLINGTAGADVLKTKGDSNNIFAGAENDTVYVQGNSNRVDAGTGNDTIHSMAGNDQRIFAGEGNDTIKVYNGSTNARASGGAGDDSFEISAGAADTQILGGDGNDTITISGNSTRNVVSGGAGVNTVRFEGKASDYTTSLNASNNLVYSKGGQVVATFLDTINNVEFFEPAVTNSTPSSVANFGKDIAVDGDTLIVSGQYLTPEANAQNKKGGVAKIFNLATASSGNLNPIGEIGIESAGFNDPGFLSKVDIQGTNVIVNSGTNSTLYDIGGLWQPSNSISQVATINNGGYGQVSDYQIQGNKVAIQTTNGSDSITKVFDLSTRQEVVSSSNNANGAASIAFDGTSVFGQLKDPQQKISKAQVVDTTTTTTSTTSFPTPTSLRSGNALEIDVSSRKAGSLGAGTANALQNISISNSVASLGNQRNLATEADLYDIDQMLANLDSMFNVISTQSTSAKGSKKANEAFHDAQKIRLDKLTQNQASTQANSNPRKVANLLP